MSEIKRFLGLSLVSCVRERTAIDKSAGNVQMLARGECSEAGGVGETGPGTGGHQGRMGRQEGGRQEMGILTSLHPTTMSRHICNGPDDGSPSKHNNPESPTKRGTGNLII